MSGKKTWLGVVVGAGLVLHGCAGMSKRTETALIAAAACGIPAAVAGGLVANNNDANVHMRVPAGAAAGLFGGALICGGLAYLLTPERHRRRRNQHLRLHRRHLRHHLHRRRRNQSRHHRHHRRHRHRR